MRCLSLENIIKIKFIKELYLIDLKVSADKLNISKYKKTQPKWLSGSLGKPETGFQGTGKYSILNWHLVLRLVQVCWSNLYTSLESSTLSIILLLYLGLIEVK